MWLQWVDVKSKVNGKLEHDISIINAKTIVHGVLGPEAGMHVRRATAENRRKVGAQLFSSEAKAIHGRVVWLL